MVSEASRNFEMKGPSFRVLRNLTPLPNSDPITYGRSVPRCSLLGRTRIRGGAIMADFEQQLSYIANKWLERTSLTT